MIIIDARSDGLISASSGELIDGNGDGITGMLLPLLHQEPPMLPLVQHAVQVNHWV